ncbi:MAG: hypothetical protein GYA24_15125 [Candidatus Lokiarchaeota archaeon]|nr:hypothetical protein [Candidatus Lokiarchaeota archaeon]
MATNTRLHNAIFAIIFLGLLEVIFLSYGDTLFYAMLEGDEMLALIVYYSLVIIFGLVILSSISTVIKIKGKKVVRTGASPAPVPPTAPVADSRPRPVGPSTPPASEPPARYPVQARAVPDGSPRGFSAPPRVIEKEQVIIKEIVKVRCSWCGTLVDQGLMECPNCGGRM